MIIVRIYRVFYQDGKRNNIIDYLDKNDAIKRAKQIVKREKPGFCMVSEKTSSGGAFVNTDIVYEYGNYDFNIKDINFITI